MFFCRRATPCYSASDRPASTLLHALLAWLFLASFAHAASPLDLEGSEENPPRIIGLTSHDGERSKVTVSSGFKLAPLGRLDREGFRVLALATTAINEENPITLRRGSRLLGVRGFVGHEWHRNNGAISLYLGPSLVTNDPASALMTASRKRIGAAMLADYWQNWDANGAIPAGYTQTTLVIDQAQKSLYLKAKHGFLVGWRGLSIGPETSLSYGQRERQRGRVVQEEWRKLRLGLHLSGLEITRWFVLGVAGGSEFQHSTRRAGYLTVSTLVRY
jgi:Cellulose biosynthesis protein BcsS